MTTHPIAEQIECVERELRFRRHVYARRVADGQMRQTQADREIALMEAVRETLLTIGREQRELEL